MYSVNLLAGFFFLLAGLAALLSWSKRHTRPDLFRGLGMLCLSGGLIVSGTGGPRNLTTVLLGCAIALVIYGALLKVRGRG
jgi:hypothetical protein